MLSDQLTRALAQFLCLLCAIFHRINVITLNPKDDRYSRQPARGSKHIHAKHSNSNALNKQTMKEHC